MCDLISILIPPFVGTDKSTQTCQNSRSPGRILYSGPSEFEAALGHSFHLRKVGKRRGNGKGRQFLTLTQPLSKNGD